MLYFTFYILYTLYDVHIDVHNSQSILALYYNYINKTKYVKSKGAVRHHEIQFTGRYDLWKIQCNQILNGMPCTAE